MSINRSHTKHLIINNEQNTAFIYRPCCKLFDMTNRTKLIVWRVLGIILLCSLGYGVPTQNNDLILIGFGDVALCVLFLMYCLFTE